MSKKPPTARGFRPVMLSQSAYNGLMAYAREHGLSASGAVQRLLDGSGDGGGGIDPDALELLMNMARLDPAAR